MTEIQQPIRMRDSVTNIEAPGSDAGNRIAEA